MKNFCLSTPPNMVDAYSKTFFNHKLLSLPADFQALKAFNFFFFFLIRKAGNSDTWASVLATAWLELDTSLYVKLLLPLAMLPSLDHSLLCLHGHHIRGYKQQITAGTILYLQPIWHYHASLLWNVYTCWIFIYSIIKKNMFLVPVFFGSCCFEWRDKKGFLRQF